jgi:hypothetical protein
MIYKESVELLNKMKLLLLTFLFSLFITPAYADDLCNELLQIEKTINAETPKQIDSATELIQIRVNCENETISYIKRIIADHELFKDGWKIRKQRQHSQLHCNKDGISSISGWTAIDIIYDKNFDYLTEFITNPNNC